MYLVVGATGSLGGQVAKRLLLAGERVRVLAREAPPARARNPHTDPGELEALGAALVRGDLLHPDTLTEVVRGVRVVVSTASGTRRGAPDTTAAVDATGTAHLAQAAAAADVERFVLVSAAGADTDAPPGLFRDKGKGAQAVAESGVPYTIIKPARFMRDWIGFVIGAQLEGGSDVVELIGDGSRGAAFVDVADVAAVVAEIARDDRREGAETVELSAERATYPEIVERLSLALGRELLVRHLEVGESITTAPEPYAGVITGLLTIHATGPTYERVERGVAEDYGIDLTSIDEFLAGLARA